MNRWKIAALTLLLLTFFLIDNAQARDKQSFDRLTSQILESFQEFYPVEATGKGIHTYDHRLADYSSSSVKKMKNKLTDYTKELYKYRNHKFSPEDDVDFKLIRSNVEIALMHLREIRWYERSPQLYVDEAIDGIYYLMISPHAPMADKLDAIVARMKGVPELFATGRRNLRQPPPLYIDLAIESLDNGQLFYREVAGVLMQNFPERADEILRVATHAREAMTDFTTFLSEVAPGEPGSFALGSRNYNYLLEHHYFLDFDADSLLRLGETLLAEAQAEYAQYRDYVDQDHQNGRDSVFVPASFTRDDILDYYQWEVDQVRTFLEQNEFVTVPEDIAPVRVIETPDFLRSMVPGIAYQPAGVFDTAQLGHFYVRPVPGDLDPTQLAARFRYVHRRGFKGSVVHEAYPGHHLQMQIAGRHPSAVRRWQNNMLMIEGWALWCEELMYDEGLYGREHPAQWLGILGGIRFRAARIVADVKLHTGQFSYQECVNWICEVLEADTEGAREYHRLMVRKYAASPGQYMTYLTGKRELQRLMEDYSARAGDQFEEREFFDRLLKEGSIPPALAREALGL